MYIYKTKDRHLQASEITTVFKKIRKFSDKHTLVCMLHVRVSWARSGGKVFLLIIFHLKMFIYIFCFLSRRICSMCIFLIYMIRTKRTRAKKCHLYVCHILRRCGSFFVLFGFFFLLFCSRQMWMKRWILFIYTNTRNHIYIYNFFSHIILRHVQLWVPFFLPCHKCSTEWLM